MARSGETQGSRPEGSGSVSGAACYKSMNSELSGTAYRHAIDKLWEMSDMVKVLEEWEAAS